MHGTPWLAAEANRLRSIILRDFIQLCTHQAHEFTILDAYLDIANQTNSTWWLNHKNDIAERPKNSRREPTRLKYILTQLRKS